MIEMLLMGTNIIKTSKIFSITSQEVLLDQHDINNQRLHRPHEDHVTLCWN